MKPQTARAMALTLLVGALLPWLAACSLIMPQGTQRETRPVTTPAAPPERQAEIAEALGMEPGRIAELDRRPLFTMDEKEVNDYLAYVHHAIPDFRDRVVHLARKNIGQPYSLHLLGEFPFETYDPLPLYNLEQSDCVVFAEHTYAMALAHDWPSFFSTLQRIRYQDGQIGVVTRNHYTESDWNPNNAWLVRDLSAELAGERAIEMQQTVRRSRFLANRYDLERDIPDRQWTDVYVPHAMVPEIEGQLMEGDLVNVMVGHSERGAYATHVGLITRGEDGTLNFLHSTPPRVREEPLANYIQRYVDSEESRRERERPVLFGFKFLRLHEDPMANLRQIDGDEAPRVVFPSAPVSGG